MKNFIIKLFNKLYLLTLAKPKVRKKYNNFLFFFLWKLRFRLSSIRPVDSKLIVFVADGGKSMSNEFKPIYELAERNGYKCVTLFHFDDTSRVALKNELSKMKADLKFQSYYARAKAVFLYDYFLPAYANAPRKGTRLVQLWHACGAFKKWGYSTKDSNWGMSSDELERYNVHKTYTDIVTSAEFVNNKYAEAFGVPMSKVSALGVARTDTYFNKEFTNGQKTELLSKYPEIGSKKIILWAPTHRGTSLNTSYNDKAIDFVKMKEAFGSDSVLLMKLHPRLANPINFSDEEKQELSGFLIDISKEISIETALCSADLVITDYSSLIFEYALLERPMIFYAYDLDEYDSQRSFYYDYRSFVPGEIAQSTEELINAIRKAENDFDVDKIRRFKSKFMSACDGHSTERIFKTFIK
ncbi:MAG: CDP-glycerol glycerophosphotransferase family protein [Ruminococcus sp.]|nr:CDP-glycerol glycerophosphotransferase family protein [Ruminococcus sp.]